MFSFARALHLAFCYMPSPCPRIQTASAVLYVMLLCATSQDLTTIFHQETASKDFAFVDFKESGIATKSSAS